MPEISPEQRDYLTRAGIGPKLHGESLRTKFPNVAMMVEQSQEFQDFQFGRKGLLMQGGRPALLASKLLVRAFILSGHTGLVVSLARLNSLLRAEEHDGSQEAADLLNSKVICITNFQNDKESPLTSYGQALVEDWLECRMEHDDQTIIHTTEEGFPWWDKATVELIADEFVRLRFDV